MTDSQEKGGLQNCHCLKLTWKIITREWQNTSTGDAWYQQNLYQRSAVPFYFPI